MFIFGKKWPIVTTLILLKYCVSSLSLTQSLIFVYFRMKCNKGMWDELAEGHSEKKIYIDLK